MIKRALLCGLGNAYKLASLPVLPLYKDLKCIIERLNSFATGEAWESIDVIDDSPKSVFVGEKNQVAMAYGNMASKENIRKSLHEIATKGADIILFYYSGHGNIISDSFYMITYNQEFFEEGMALWIAEINDFFLDDSEYKSCINELLIANTGLTVITIIDSCFSSSIDSKNISTNNISDRHLIFSSGAHEAKSNDNDGSLFTKSLMEAAKVSTTYATLKENITNTIGTAQKPFMNIDQKYNDIVLPF
jgi:hypothetical protein